MSQDEKRPRIGVGVVTVKEGQILLGKRKNAHGAGEWALPGGHLEFGESLEACAQRELEEETGLLATSLRAGPWSNDVIEGKHYITFFVYVEAFEGEVELKEPHKCEGWQWFPWDELPEPLFAPIRTLQKSAETLEGLMESLLRFYRERDWQKYHSPKNLIMNLASEVGELIEPFRWLREDQSHTLDEKTHLEVLDEIGDVFTNIIYISHQLGIDPVKAALQKLEKMKEKYPVETCFGKALKYTAYISEEK